jgi:DNA-binding MarR family transcriptional regulator
MQLRLNGELSRQLAAESGLSFQDYQVLVVLTEHPEGRIRVHELARLLGWEKSRVSHHIARMVDRGLVKKGRCETDRRGAFLSATPRGRREIEAAAPGHVDAVRRLFIDALTPRQLDALADVAECVLDAMDCREPD